MTAREVGAYGTARVGVHMTLVGKLRLRLIGHFTADLVCPVDWHGQAEVTALLATDLEGSHDVDQVPGRKVQWLLATRRRQHGPTPQDVVDKDGHHFVIWLRLRCERSAKNLLGDSHGADVGCHAQHGRDA